MITTTISILFLTTQSLSTINNWDYDHMSEWSDSFPMCDNQDQSPIDINSSQVIHNDQICNAFFDWDIQYDITNFQLTNTGHSVILKPVTQSNIDGNNDLSSTLIDSDGTEYQTLTESENTIATFPNYFKPSDSSHEEFCLHSLHFHWGLNDTTGSEHFLNGYQYPLEAQFVHFSCKHSSLAVTLDQFASENSTSDMENAGVDIHQLGVVGIFFDVIEDYINPAFEIFLNDNINALDILPGHASKIIHGLNLEYLIPETIDIDGYYAYEGSLTTPPCSNIVRWHIMNATGKIGKSQMEKWRKLYLRQDGQSVVPIAPNYRDIQENVNEVYGCMSEPHMNDNLESIQLSVVEVIIICAVVTGIIIGIATLILRLRSNYKSKSKLTKSSSVNQPDEQYTSDPPPQMITRDQATANKSYSIDI